MATRRGGPRRWPQALGVAALPLIAALHASAAAADEEINIKLPPISLGAGLRTSFTHTSNDAPTPNASDFALDSVRLYVNGSVTPYFKVMVNTEYTGSPPAGSNTVEVLDAVGRFEWNDKLNIWFGRFLPPSDRANLYGPYYASNWKVYEDGVQDGYPSVATGRDNGIAYWGQFGPLKVSAGVFDIPATTAPNPDAGLVVTAARLQLDLWDPEPGYYLNGTYYGEKDLLAIGLAGQTTADRHALSADVLIEKNLHGAGTVTFEGEFARYDKLGGYGGFDGSYRDSNGWYGLVAYLLPQKVFIGRFQLLGKYGRAGFHDSTLAADPSYGQRTAEVDLNYIIKSFDARMSVFFKRTALDGPLPDQKQVGVGLQLQI